MSRYSRMAFALLLVGTAAVVAKAYFSPPEPPLKVAFQVCNSMDENRRRFEPIRAYLEKKLGRKVIAFHVNTFDFLEKAQAAEFDVLQANGYIYVNIRSKLPATLLAREVKADTGKDTGGLIVVRADSPVRSIEGLKGKTMAFGPVFSPGAYLTQYYTMIKAGFDPEKSLGKYTFPPGSWQHEKVVYSVLYGAADAGAVKVGDLERMEEEGKVARSDFRVIAESEPVPNCAFFALPHVDASTAGRVGEALLRLSAQDFVEVEGERVNVLARNGAKGYVTSSDEEFEVLRRMAKAASLPPYGKY